jgi:hypothetical protein
MFPHHNRSPVHVIGLTTANHAFAEFDFGDIVYDVAPSLGGLLDKCRLMEVWEQALLWKREAGQQGK